MVVLHGVLHGVLRNGVFHGIEIKGSCRKGHTWSTFTFKGIRLKGTHWKHLLLLGRTREPRSWKNISDVESSIWLGYIRVCMLRACMRALSSFRRFPGAFSHPCRMHATP